MGLHTDKTRCENLKFTEEKYPATVLQNSIITKLYILNPESTPKNLCETARFLLTILDISITIGLMLINNGGIMYETKRCN